MRKKDRLSKPKQRTTIKETSTHQKLQCLRVSGIFISYENNCGACTEFRAVQTFFYLESSYVFFELQINVSWLFLLLDSSCMPQKTLNAWPKH